MSVRRGIVLSLKLILAIGLLTWLVLSGRLDFSVLSTVHTNWYWLLAALILFGMIQWMTAIRWRWLLEVVGQECSTARSFMITLAGLLFNQVLIGSTGGDIYRVMAFDVENSRQRVAVLVSVAMDRLIGLFALVILVPFAALWNMTLVSESELLTVIIAGSLAGVIGLPIICWVLYRRQVRFSDAQASSDSDRLVTRWAGYLRDGIGLFSGHWSVVIKSIIFSVLIQGLIVVVNIFIAISILGTDIPWSSMFILIPVAMLAMAVPINPPGAIGTGEALYAVLLELAGIAHGSVISLLQRLIIVIWSIPGALALILPVGRYDSLAGRGKSE